MYNGEQQQQQTQRTSVHNTLHLELPGLSSALQVRFPDCRLPVCGRCKKNYKTRDMCRTQAGHTALPWSTVYICATFDHTCTDSNNNLKSGTFTARNIEWMPYCYKSDVSSETLICAACKTKNYTRKQCRIKSRHRYLPWSTVYVVLSCESNEDSRISSRLNLNSENSRRESGSNTQQGSSSKRRATNGDNEQGPSKKRASGVDVPNHSQHSDTESDEDTDTDASTSPKKNSPKSESIRKVDKSRTFLIEVDEEKCIIKWLDFDKSKGTPMQYYPNALPTQTTSRSHFQAQSVPSSNASGNIFAPGSSRLYQLPVDSIHNGGQFFPTDNQTRQHMHQLLPSQQAQFLHWQGPSATSLNHHTGTNRQFTEDSLSERAASLYQEHYEQQMQVQAYAQSQSNPRNWATYPGPSFDGSQMMSPSLMPLQQGRVHAALYQPSSYQDADQDNGQYNLPPSYQYHNQF